jgi:hypothetical protein
LKDILIAIQTTIISSLRRALGDDVRLDYTALQSELKANEDNAVACLRRLSRNLLARAAAASAAAVKAAAARAAVAMAAAARAEGNLQTGHSMPHPMRRKPLPEAPTYPENWPQNDSKPPGKVHQINSAQSPQGLDGNATSTVSVMRTVIEEPENGRLSDIDMDRFSAVSLTASSLSSSASFHSLARRIRRWKSRAERNPMDELPSSVMKWDSSSSSLQLFSQLSDTLSVASSQKTDGSRMSWRPEIPATIQER